MSKSIGFDELMDEHVTYVDAKVADIYVLCLDDGRYEFKDTADIVPFVEKELGYKVVF